MDSIGFIAAGLFGFGYLLITLEQKIWNAQIGNRPYADLAGGLRETFLIWTRPIRRES
jgi:hypothetical protein